MDSGWSPRVRMKVCYLQRRWQATPPAAVVQGVWIDAAARQNERSLVWRGTGLLSLSFAKR